MLLLLFAAAAVAEAPPPAAPADLSVGTVVVEGRAPTVGDLQKGVLNFTPQYFVRVRPSTAMDMVQWLPGFSFQDTRDVRGLDGAGGNVLIDGKPPASKTDTLQSVLRRIPSEQVERVDIIVGGAPGIDMRGWPVLANVIRKKNSKARLTYSLEANLDTHGRISPNASANFSRRNGDRALEGSIQLGRSFDIGPAFGYGPTVRTDAAGAAIYTADTHANATGSYVIASGVLERAFAGGKLKLNATGRDFGGGVIQADALRGGPAYGFKHVQTYHQGELGLTYEHSLGKRTSLETQAVERITRYEAVDTLTRPPAPSELIKSDDAEEGVVRATLRFRKSDRLALAASAEGAINTDKTHARAFVGGTLLPLPGEVVNVREQRGEVGSSLSWKPGPEVSLESGVKLEASTLNGHSDLFRVDRTFTYVKPRTVFTWSPDKDDQLRLRIEHEVGQIGFGSFAARTDYITGQIITGAAHLKPQRAWVGEAVLERQLWTGGDLSVTLRQKRLIDLLGYIPILTPSGVVAGRANVGTGGQTDLNVNLLLPLKRLGLEGGTIRAEVTWSHSRFTDPNTGRRVPLADQSSVVAELHLVEDLPAQKLTFGLDAFYFSPSTELEPAGSQKTGMWARFDLYVQYRVGPTLTVQADIDNLPGNKLRQTIDAYTSLRGASPLLYRDDKRLAVGPVFFVRVRRTLQ